MSSDSELAVSIRAQSDLDADRELIESSAEAEKQDTFEEVPITRQWVSLPHGSCDVRLGSSVITHMGEVLKGSIGRPRGCALAVQKGTDGDLVTAIRRQLTGAGFLVSALELPAEGLARTHEAVARLSVDLASAHITADDLIVAVGKGDALSMVSYVAQSWCGGVSLACVPLDATAAITGSVTPCGFDVAGIPELICVRGYARYLFVDMSYIQCDPHSESVRLVRALMATTATAESEKSFSKLWDRANDITAGNLPLFARQLLDTIKSRGHLVASTSMAVRQAVTYGDTFVRALRVLVGPRVSKAALYAEAMRFTARLACGKGDISVDDVLTVDELLERLDLGGLTCRIDPEAMIAALRSDCFARSARFMLELPRSIGRVRLSAIEDDLLAEHVGAWCAVHAPA